MAQFTIIAGPDTTLMSKNFTILDGHTIGSNPLDSIFLNSRDVLPQHVRVRVVGKTVSISAGSPESTILVNGDAIQSCILAHGDMVVIGDFILMFDEGLKEKKITSVGENILESRIESRQKYYDSAQHILESLGEGDKSQSRLVTLYKISNAISGILDMDQLLKRFLEIILEEFPADRGFIMLFDSVTQKLSPVAVIAKHGDAVAPKISNTIINEVFSTKESLLCQNIMEDVRFKAQESLVGHNIGAAMCVPLIRKGEILGLIHVDSQKRDKFSQSDLDLLTKVAMQAAIVIENAHFYKIRQEFNRNLLALSDATQSLSSYLRQDLIIQEATKCATQIFNAKRSFLFLKQGADNLTLVSAKGVEMESLKDCVIPQRITKVAQENRLLAISGNEPADFENPENSGNSDILPFLERQKCLLAVPVSSQQQNAMGVLCVAGKEDDHPFSIEDQQLLTILAGYTAIALSNSTFYEEIKRKEKEIAEWNLQLEKRVADRTEKLKAVQGKLIQSEKMAAVGLLAAGVSHEFNNIIASMYGFAQIAKKNEKYQEKLVDIVISQSKRACEITENLMSFSKQTVDSVEMVNVHELLENVFKLTSTALGQEGIQVVKEYGEIPRTLLNSGKIQQVFMNIIINARDAIEKNGTITVTTSMSSDKQWINIAIKDTGKGIEPENIGRVFEPFYTTKGSFGGGTQPGIGIGLSLCYNIIKLHGGDITLSSELGKGTCFTVILPVRTEIPKSSEESTEDDRFKPKIFADQRVLLVENQDKRELIIHALEDKGFHVRHVLDTLEAIEVCKKDRFHYIFIDALTLQSQDGVKILQEIKRMEPNIKIILITGRAEDASIMQYVGYANGYLRKPFDAEDIYCVLGINLNPKQSKTQRHTK